MLRHFSVNLVDDLLSQCWIVVKIFYLHAENTQSLLRAFNEVSEDLILLKDVMENSSDSAFPQAGTLAAFGQKPSPTFNT
jgi:hypothetical protein